MTPESAKPLRDVVADHVREQIILGSLRPGQRVREDEVASVHGISRVPVREAVQKLAAEGYIVLVPYRGAVVASPTPQRSLEVIQVRRALEPMAARLAAQRRGGEHATELTRLVKRGSRAARTGRYDLVPDLVDQFHRLVASASGNSELVETLALVRDKVRWMFAVDIHGRSASSWADHTAIAEAIVTGDAAQAMALMDAHVGRDEDLCRQMPPQSTYLGDLAN